MALADHPARSSLWELFSRRWRYERYLLSTPLSVAECRLRLTEDAQLKPDAKIGIEEYRGIVTPFRFSISHIGDVPTASGVFTRHSEHTEIDLQISNSRWGFLAVFLTAVGGTALVILSLFLPAQDHATLSEEESRMLLTFGRLHLLASLALLFGLWIHSHRKIPQQMRALITKITALLDAEIIATNNASTIVNPATKHSELNEQVTL